MSTSFGYNQSISTGAATPAPAPAAPAGDLIKDTTTAAFRGDVLNESMKQPVLVDFWAPWCGPCKQLTPVLEKVVKAAKGKIKLVKMNIDEHPQIAGQLGVQSIPAVFAFDKGQPIDGFMGALPESQLKSFIERLIGPLGGGLEEVIAAAAEKLEAKDHSGAAELYAAVLAQEEGNAKALSGLSRVYLETGEMDLAKRMIEMVPEASTNTAEVLAAKAAIELAEQAEGLGELADLEKAIAADPKDHQARFDLAVALNAKNKREEAVDHLIAIVKADRTWNEDGARKQLLQFFEAWGPMDEASIGGRRKLSALIFR
jgi:putative thioredoxin